MHVQSWPEHGVHHPEKTGLQPWCHCHSTWWQTAKGIALMWAGRKELHVYGSNCHWLSPTWDQGIATHAHTWKDQNIQIICIFCGEETDGPKRRELVFFTVGRVPCWIMEGVASMEPRWGEEAVREGGRVGSLHQQRVSVPFWHWSACSLWAALVPGSCVSCQHHWCSGKRLAWHDSVRTYFLSHLKSRKWKGQKRWRVPESRKESEGIKTSGWSVHSVRWVWARLALYPARLQTDLVL